MTVRAPESCPKCSVCAVRVHQGVSPLSGVCPGWAARPHSHAASASPWEGSPSPTPSTEVLLVILFLPFPARYGQHSAISSWSTSHVRSSWGSCVVYAGETKAQGRPYHYSCLKGGCCKVGVNLYFQVTGDKMRWNGLNLHQGRLRLDFRKSKWMSSPKVI